MPDNRNLPFPSKAFEVACTGHPKCSLINLPSVCQDWLTNCAYLPDFQQRAIFETVRHAKVVSLGNWRVAGDSALRRRRTRAATGRSEEHTSELQSRFDLVCR